MNPPDIGKKILSLKYIWLALISENFMMIYKHVLKDSEVDPKMWNLVSKCNFYVSDPLKNSFLN